MQATELKGQVKNQGETLNFELAGLKNWDYDLKRIKEKSKTKIQLIIKNSDQSSAVQSATDKIANSANINKINKIANVENPFVENVVVKQQEVDKKWTIEFILKNDSVETFDYLTDQPSKLIIDFYINDNLKNDLSTAANSQGLLTPNMTNLAKKDAKGKTAKLKDKLLSRKPADADFLKLDAPGGIETQYC